MLARYFLWSIFQVSCAYPFCYDSTESPCTFCESNHKLLQGVCLEICPSGCTDNESSCSCLSGTNDVFDVEFHQNTDIQVKSLNDFTENTDLTGVELIHRTDPSPTKQRGYYFEQGSSYKSTQEFFPGLTNALTYWVQPSHEGRVITMADSTVHYKVDRAGEYWILSTKYTKTSDGAYETDDLSIKAPNIHWKKVSVMMEQTVNDACTLKGLVDDALKNETTVENCWLSFQFDSSSTLDWIIGKSDANSFVGCLYRVLFRNSHVSESLEFVHNYFNHLKPYDDQCARHPIDLWICGGTCKSGPSVQGVCMLDCPYSFDCTSHMESLPTDPVLEENFDGSPCSYTHFQSGSDASTCFPSTNPQKDDVVPLKGRGAYYNSNKFVKSKDQVYLYHTFSIRLWVYHISGSILKKGSELVIDNSEVKTKLKNQEGSYRLKEVSNPIASNTWVEIGLSCKFSFGTTLRTYKDGSIVETETSEDLIFRQIKSLHFFMGDFNGEGIVYNFKLWQNEVDLSGTTTGPLDNSGYTSYQHSGFQSCTCDHSFTPCPTDTLNACMDGDQYLCVEDVPHCNDCPNNCKTCSSKEYYECTSCLVGAFLLEGFMCVEECPSGLWTNPVDRSCGLGERLGLKIQFNNFIRVESFNFKEEPYPSKLRGYYFYKNFYGQNSAFVIGPQFTILGWIRLEEDGILLSKGYTEPILRFNSGKLQGKVETESGETVSLESTSSFKDTWTYFSVSGEILSDGKTKFVLKVGDNHEHEYTTSEATFFSDNKQVGFELVLGNDTNSFIGFLWSIRIYNIHGMETEGFSTTGCPSECSGFCPTELICPSNCELNQYIDGTGCSPCKAECNEGCVRPENCHLCADELCRRCGYFTEFYESKKSCSRCKSNAHFNGDICECNLKYYKNEAVKACYACTPGCDRCTSSLFTNCTQCSSTHFPIQGVCHPFCPSGHCNPVDDFVFHLKPHAFQDTVTDTQSFIPVLTGHDNSFYPTPGVHDPIPAKDRGYYFTGTSCMQLPPYNSVTTPLLTLAPEFTIAMWINPSAPGGTLLSKQSNALENYLRLYLDNYSPKVSIRLFLTNSQVSHSTADPLTQDSWNFISVQTRIENDHYNIKVFSNSAFHDSTNLAQDWFKDLKNSFIFRIGAQSSSFTGFLWEVKVFNSEKDSSTLLSTTCSGCSQCPLSGNCLPNCGIDSYWDGTKCVLCESSCSSKGCVRNDIQCNLCEDQQCWECSDYVGSCSDCITHASTPSDCECDLTFYWNDSTETCNSCTANCDACTSSSFLDCTDCSSGYSLTQGVCHPFCPTGYSPNSGTCDLDDDFVFHLQPRAIQDTVTDTQSSIPVLTGKDTSFYPTPDSTDPIPAKDRGYYFTGTSYMQLSTSPSLALAPEFILAMWIRPTADSGTILTKQKDSSGVSTKFKVSLNSKQPQLDLDLTSSSHSSTDSVEEGWNFLVVGVHLDPAVPEFRVSAYLNTTKVISSTLGNDWLVDLEDSYLFSIGAKHSDQTTFNNFYTGFLWEIRIYNSHKGPTTLLESSSCDSCSFCPIDNQNECLPSCLITEFWDGNDCVECDSECTSGCSRQHTCNLCANSLCASCSSFEEEDCSECKANASGNPCVCDPGYGLDRLDLECIECKLSMGREVVNSKCYCAKGYFNNNSTGIDCQECHSTCETCSGPEPTDCLSCDGFYLYEDGSCGPCPDGTYLEGTECLECMELCAICTSEDECTNCVENAFINLNNTCSCNKGFTSLNNTCECLSGSIRDEVCTDFYSNLTCDNDNLLTLAFSEELVSSLTKEGIAIQLQNKTIEYTYSFKEVNKAKYEMKLEFNTYYVSEGELATLKFLSEINSTSGFSLEVKQLETSLSKHDTYNPLVDNGKETAQVVLGVAGAMGGVSILINGNPADIWSMLNNIQLLSYLVMSNNPLTPTLKGLFEGLDVFQYISDLFSYLLELLTGKDSKNYEKKYGITSEMFLFNAGVNIVIMLLMLLSWPLVWLLSKIPHLQNRLKPVLREYKYNAFIRYWVQCYLELSVACFIQVSSVPDSETIGVVNFIVGFLVTCSIVATPFVLFWFCKKYKDWITNLTDESNFYLSWGTLFYEFNCSSNFNPSLTYPVFILRRMLLSMSLVLLGDLPYIQAGINAALSIGYTVFLFKVTPYKEAKTQLASASAEVVVSLVFLLVTYFLQTNFRGIDWLVEICIVCSTVGAIVFQSLVAICYFVYQKCCKKEQVEISGVTEIDSTQNHLFFHRRNQAKVVPEVTSPENKVTENNILEDPN